MVFRFLRHSCSGWRLVGIGTPAQGRAVPIIYNLDRSSAIDVVFVPDQQNYAGGPNNSVFQNDVANAIGLYYSEDIFLNNQNQLNFWIALDSGNAIADAAGSACGSTAPGNWDDSYGFADVGAILHRDPLIQRNCAQSGQHIFTALGGGTSRSLLHETGHQPFGLTDEYCNKRPGSPSTVTVCDPAFYQADPYPNVFQSLEGCQADPLSAGRTCQGWTSDICGTWPHDFTADEFDEDFDSCTWFTSDPPSNDLMVENLNPQAFDRRRIDTYMFNEVCVSGGC